MSLQGRVAIVTGAAQGIGRAIAEKLAEAGADIVVADLDPARSTDTVAAVEKLGRKALNVKVNVADANDTKAMADQVINKAYFTTRIAHKDIFRHRPLLGFQTIRPANKKRNPFPWVSFRFLLSLKQGSAISPGS